MKKISKIFIITAALLFLSFPLISCSSVIETFNSIMEYNNKDYILEEVIHTYSPNDEVSLELAEMTRMLSIESPYLEEFSGAGEASSKYRDCILNYILTNNYSKYTGNIKLLDKAMQEYPQYHITTLIPLSDFEYTVYRYFGGNEKINNKDGTLFKYLDKVEAYTSIGQPQKNILDITVTSCEETQNTFRLTFYNTVNDIVSPEYFALIVKREDGTMYIDYLTEAD